MRLEPNLFAEGITFFKNKFFQLTWRENSLLIYKKDSFERDEIKYYSGEGWGLTHDGMMI